MLGSTYVAEFHNVEDEPIFPHGPISLTVDDNVKLSAQQYREQLYSEISMRRKKARNQRNIPNIQSSMVPQEGVLTSNDTAIAVNSQQ